MDTSGEASRVGPTGRRERIDDKDFFEWVREQLGPEVMELLCSAPIGIATPAEVSLDALDDKQIRLLRQAVASDAVRASLKRGLGSDLSFLPDGKLELWPTGRISMPPTDADSVCMTARMELPSAMAIIHLVQGRMHGSRDEYYGHEPKGLAAKEIEELLKLMSVRSWRRGIELRHSLHLAFRAPFNLAAAKAIDNPHMRYFVSLEEQMRTGFF